MFLDQDQLSIDRKIASRTKRILAFGIDHFFMTFLIVMSSFLLMGPSFMDPTKLNDSPYFVLVVFGFGSLLYFLKDSFSGKSFGKWVLGVEVRDYTDPNKIPSVGRLLLRNLLLLVWPVELIAVIIDENKRRIGDKLAKTTVLESEKKPRTLIRVLVLVSLTVTMLFSLFLLVSSLMKSSDAYKVAIQTIEANYDVQERTGGIKSYGLFPKGSVKMTGTSGLAKFQIRVNGKNNDLNVHVKLIKDYEGEWEVREMERYSITDS